MCGSILLNPKGDENLPSATTLQEREVILLSETSQPQKDKYRISSLRGRIETS